MDTYSVRSFRWNAIQMLDYAAERKLDNIQASQGDFESLDDAYLKKVKEHAAKTGVGIEPGFGCISPLSRGYNKKNADAVKYLAEGLRTAKALGSDSFRVFVGNITDRMAGTPMSSLIEDSVKTIRALRTQLQDAKVRVAIENHGDFQARDVRTLIEQAGKDITSSCLDIGNPVNVIEDPFETLEVLGPYASTTHVRDAVVYEHPRGAAAQWVAMGDGNLDLKKFAQRYREICPKTPMLLEIITGRPPMVIPYLEPDFWKGFQDTPASSFARYVALVKSGRPFMGSMMIPPASGQVSAEFKAAVKEQERYDLDRSLEYAKKVMDMGVRWRG